MCTSQSRSFPFQYASYHHFKSKGWIVRSGLLYGVDWVLYQLHPAHAHSDCGVIVVAQNDHSGSTTLGWRDICIAQRLINQVSKDLVLLYLQAPPGLDLSTPNCVAQIAAEERLVSRWVPEATR